MEIAFYVLIITNTTGGGILEVPYSYATESACTFAATRAKNGGKYVEAFCVPIEKDANFLDDGEEQ